MEFKIISVFQSKSRKIDHCPFNKSSSDVFKSSYDMLYEKNYSQFTIHESFN